MDLFIRLTNVLKAVVNIPSSIMHNEEEFDKLVGYAYTTENTTMGIEPPDDDTDNDLLEEDIEIREHSLKMRTARIARGKLDAVTHNGRYKMWEPDYEAFLKAWGTEFQKLEYWEAKGKFAGKWHYVKPILRDPSENYGWW